MSGVFNKLAGVLGFSNEAEDLDDDYDSYGIRRFDPQLGIMWYL